MKKRVWMALCLQACLLAACSSEMTDPPVGADNGWLEVNFTNPETRTSLDDSGAGSFSDGDKAASTSTTVRMSPTANSPTPAAIGCRCSSAATSATEN